MPSPLPSKPLPVIWLPTIVNVYRPSETEPPESTDPPVKVSVTKAPDPSTAADNVTALPVFWLTSENAADGLPAKPTFESKAIRSEVTIERCTPGAPGFTWMFATFATGLGEPNRWP
jgi:hypothetical protein